MLIRLKKLNYILCQRYLLLKMQECLLRPIWSIANDRSLNCKKGLSWQKELKRHMCIALWYQRFFLTGRLFFGIYRQKKRKFVIFFYIHIAPCCMNFIAK